MYNALIVDDEKSILENIQKAIPWEELGIETVFTAQNGSDALSLLEAYHIDLLISDIRMPGMDGLTLLKHVRAVYCIEQNHSRLADPAQRQLALYLSHHRRYSHYLSGTLAFQLFPSASRSRHGEKAGEDTSAEAHLQHCFFPLCSGCRRIPFQRYRHAQLVCQLRGHLISYEYCQGLLCLFSVFYFFCTGKRVPRPVHQTSWRIQDCFSSVVRSLFLVFAWPSLAANRPIPHCSLRFLSFCNIPYHTC